jgi:hypothetical protein
VAGLANWHHQLIATQDRVVVLCYENLVARESRPLRALAERLGVALNDAEIAGLYERYLHRDLLPAVAPGHYYRGGNDKWKQVFLAQHVRAFLAQGFQSICERWGYDLTFPQEGTATSRPEGGPSGQKAGLLPLDSLLQLKDDSFNLEPFPLRILSNTREWSLAIRAALHGPDFMDHLNAAGLDSQPPSWMTPIPWTSMAPFYAPIYATEAYRARRQAA